MIQYALRRGAATVPVVIGVVTLVFMMLRFLPGDPAAFILGEGAQQESIERLRIELGLERPLLEQYLDFVAGLVTLDLGESVVSRLEVRTLVFDAMPVTLVLGGLSMVFGFLIAVPLGAYAAFNGAKGKTWVDQGLTTLALMLDVIPGFWLALVLMLFFTLNLGWFPATGPVPWTEPIPLMQRLALPLMVLTLAQIGVIARVTRTAVYEVLGEDFVRTARAMGTPELGVLFRHALRNAALPVVTVAGLSFGRLLGGTVITETIFALPGMGNVLVQGILGRDYPVVQGVVLLYASLFVLVNLATDIAYTRLDPRVKL